MDDNVERKQQFRHAHSVIYCFCFTVSCIAIRILRSVTLQDVHTSIVFVFSACMCVRAYVCIVYFHNSGLDQPVIAMSHAWKPSISFVAGIPFQLRIQAQVT